MAGLNKVILIGRLGQDPVLRYTPSGNAVANFSIATSENWNDKEGQRQERTEWHRLVVWGKVAELCGQYLAKGREVCVEGKLQTREWSDRDSNKRTTTEVVATQVTFLGSRNDNGGGGGNAGGNNNRPRGMTSGDMAGGSSQGGGQGGGSGGSGGGGGGSSNTGGGNAGGGQGDASFDYGPPPNDDDVPF
jgi:single-strand DNA-binding protein